MRPMRALGSAIAGVLVAGCVMPGGGGVGSPTSSSYEASAAPRSNFSVFQQVRDSLNAQAIADREGPGVNVRVEMTNVSGSRRARAYFTLDDDAYVVVGHIDADGVVRITFPAGPEDDGFAQGQHSYRTTEFFAGFLQDYRYRATTGLFHYTAATPDSYDGGLGFVFVIASWRPMHFDRFSTNGQWDSFELADEQTLTDPRPAIYELASLLSGENREAYTVKFARYTSTTDLYDGAAYSSLASSAYGGSFCNGFAPFGYAWSPFASSFGGLGAYGGLGAFNGFGEASFGENFYYRGTEYLYNAAGDCYTTYHGGGAYGYGLGTLIAQTPTTQQPARIFNIDGLRPPLTPRPLPGYKLPVNANGGSADPAGAQASPHYRDRGLLTADDPSIRPVHRDAHIDARAGGEQAASRPSIQQLINRHEENASQSGGSGSGGWSRAQNARNAGINGNQQGTPRNEGGGQRQFSPDGSRGSPSSQSRGESARSSPSPSPAAAPRAPSPSPAPAPAASSSSSSGSGTPIKP